MLTELRYARLSGAEEKLLRTTKGQIKFIICFLLYIFKLLLTILFSEDRYRKNLSCVPNTKKATKTTQIKLFKLKDFPANI